MKTRKSLILMVLLSLFALLLGAFGAMAQDEDAMAEADAMIRAFDAAEMPEGWDSAGFDRSRH